MKADIIIVCPEDDFYLGDMICQEMEARGKNVLFNLRDAHTPDNLGFRYFNNAPVYIAVVNGGFLGVKNFTALTTHKTADSKVKSFLFVNEDNVGLPHQWSSATVIDANAGWEDELMDSIASHAMEEIPLSYQASRQNATPASRAAATTAAPSTGGRLVADHKHPKPSPATYTLALRNYPYDNRYASEQERLEAIWHILGRHNNDRIEDMLLPEASESMMVKRAMKYYTGDGVVRDLERSHSLLKRAVAEDPEDMEALYYLAVFNETGESGAKNLEEAKQIYEMTMERGFAPSMLRLGCIAMNSGTPDSEETSLEIFRKCRKAGDFRASYWIGLHAEKTGQLEDAYEYYSEAAEEGYAPAQNALGCMYFEGMWVKKDERKGAEWIRLAAEQGLPVAMANLGDLMIRMNGMNEDAKKLIRQAAADGDERGVALCEKLDMYARREREEAIRRRKEEEKQAQWESLLDSVGELGKTLFRGTK